MKSTNQRQAEFRERNRELGRSEMRIWVTPTEREAIKQALKDIRASQVYNPVIEAIKK